MKKQYFKYLIFPIFYVLSVLLLEFYPNALIAGIAFIFFIYSIIGIFRILNARGVYKEKVLPIIILSIPLINLIFGISNKVRDEIKGKIVLSIIDDSFATTKSILVREKNGLLIAEYDFSVAGFGATEKANVNKINDTVLLVELIDRDHREKLIYKKIDKIFKNEEENIYYRILDNELFD